MRYSSTHKARAREQILAAAEKILRLRGLDGVGIDAVMAEAGMTSGAFYSQFKSKKELLSEVFARGCDALDQYFSQARKAGGLPGIVDAYLSPKHREDIAGGCTVTSLIGDLVRSDKDTKRKMTVYLKKAAQELSQLLPHARRSQKGEAWAVLAIMIGGLQMARATGDKRLSNAILQSCRCFIMDHA
jgi:TetR/AcrR family transcriptional regulator, transcriptional repressor for nem operon